MTRGEQLAAFLLECSGTCTGCGKKSDALEHFGKGNVLCPECAKGKSDLPKPKGYLVGQGLGL